MPSGVATLDFGVFPGASDASVAVTGQAAILASSLVEAWIFPDNTTDHTDTEHMVETLRVFAPKTSIVPGTGFTIYGFNTSQVNSPVPGQLLTETSGGPSDQQVNADSGGLGTRIYGKWSIAWVWV